MNDAQRVTRITISDYMAVSDKGRACQRRRTSYLVTGRDAQAAVDAAYATHERRIADGDLAAPYVVKGYGGNWDTAEQREGDYVIS
jgi:hypothetical protein